MLLKALVIIGFIIGLVATVSSLERNKIVFGLIGLLIFYICTFQMGVMS
jgi:hypothetical protein